jgi:hypothetical protein
LYPYNDILDEYDAAHLKRVKSVLGGLPCTTLCVEFRRSKGSVAIDTAEKFVSALLKRFPGLADDLVEDLWTLEEISHGTTKQGRRFLDCYRGFR